MEFQHGKIFALYKMEVIDHRRLIEWADSVIQRSGCTDDWFIDLSMSSKLSRLDVESILIRKISDVDTLSVNEFLGGVAFLFFSGRSSPKKVISFLYDEVCLSDSTRV